MPGGAAYTLLLIFTRALKGSDDITVVPLRRQAQRRGGLASILLSKSTGEQSLEPRAQGQDDVLGGEEAPQAQAPTAQQAQC